MTTALHEKREAVAVDPRAGKYLSFCLGAEEFAVQVVHVREIICLQEITPVPQTPAAIKGVINLRGKVIPVIDLRFKFGLPERAHTERTCMVVIQVETEGSTLSTGMIVDEVSEVLSLAGGEIEPTPDFGDGVAMPYLLGLAKVRDKVKILLDIAQVVKDQQLAALPTLRGVR